MFGKTTCVKNVAGVKRGHVPSLKFPASGNFTGYKTVVSAYVSVCELPYFMLEKIPPLNSSGKEYLQLKW